MCCRGLGQGETPLAAALPGCTLGLGKAQHTLVDCGRCRGGSRSLTPEPPRCPTRATRVPPECLAEQPLGLDPRAGGVGKGVMAAGRSFRRSRALSAPALAAPTSNLKIFLFHIKGIIYKRESSYYPLITGSVPVTPSNPHAVSRLAINAIGALYLGSSIVTN